MITILSTLSGKYFSCTIPDVVFSITGYRAAVNIKVDGTLIFSENLYPLSGKIMIRDLANLITPYAKQSLAVSMDMDIVEEFESDSTTNTSSVSADIIYCEADFGTNAPDFIANHYLSILLGTKITALGRLEYLHYIGTDPATVIATYGDGSTDTFKPVPTGGNDKYTTIDVSPAQFAVDHKLLVSYSVSAGSRSQEYELDLNAPDCAPVLIFDNSFGVEELLYCTGVSTLSPTYTRSSAYVNGLNKNYDIEEKKSIKADSGVLNFAMANWAQELFRSKYIRIVNFYAGKPVIGKEIIITDSKDEYSNGDDTLPRFTFSYQYAQRNHNVVDLKRSGRIFDNTFDNTFE